MGDVYRSSRIYRDRDSDSEDDRYRKTTVTRYKVTPDRHHDDRFDRSERYEVDDDRRSRYSGRGSGDFLDARGPLSPGDRPRSAFDPYGRDRGDRSRTVYYERDVERDVHRDYHREPDRSRITVFESKETDRDWDKRSHHGGHKHEEEVKVEKKVEERFDDDHGHEVERYRKETEYYAPQSPPPAPVIIRQQSQEPQKIIVQEAPAPAPIVVPRQQPGVVVVRDREQDREMVRRERDPYDEDYYYRHERREMMPYRGDRDRDRERDWAMARYDPRYHDRRRRDDDYYSDDEDYYVRKTVVRRQRDRSESPHHKRHLAEGALAGAGVSALLSSRRDAYGDLPEHRGRKVIAGAALGALGTEVVRRAHSAYEDRFGDGRDESPDHHSTLKKGLGIAAVALAAAGAAKYMQSNKVEKEEAHRGRSRTRGYYSGDDYSRSPSRTSRRSKSRHRSMSTAAKAVLGTAATAGIIKHFRDKSKSKSRTRSVSRSKSRLRRVAEIGGVAAAAGVANKMWKNHKEKKENEERSRDLSDSDDDYYRRRDSRSGYRSRSGSRYRSRSRSMPRSPYMQQPGTDPELGLVEYGNDPLYPDARRGDARDLDTDADERRRSRRRRRRRDGSRSSGSASDDEHERKRSRSRFRDMAAAGAAAGAAAMGIKEFKGRKDRREQERRDRRSSRDDSRRRYDDEPGYFDQNPGGRTHSPPTASGGAYYPPYPPTPGGPPMASGANNAPYPEPNGGAPLHNDYQPYVPQDYTGYAPPPPPPAGPPPAPEPGYGYPPPGGPPGPPPPPAGPPPGGNHPPDHVSDHIRSQESPAGDEVNAGVNNANSPYRADVGSGPPGASKSVSFIPLSPKSSKTMERHRKEQGVRSDEEDNSDDDHDDHNDHIYDDDRRVSRRRRHSAPSSSRSVTTRRDRRGRHDSDSDSESEIEHLPDRFDSQGRPLDGRAASQDRWTTRRGTFRKEPQRPGGWDVQGAWQVSGTDGEAVDRLVKNFTGALDGQKGWMGVLGNVLGSGLLNGAGGAGEGSQGGGQSRINGQRDGDEDVDDGDDDRRRRRRKRR